ncbi:MAG TPA: hypothetical protein VJA17_05635 [Candidatus Omnitrophota bacterium]|nr:hypothetical protein [Candidatus Omnitrophota bacterium]
MKIYKLNKAVLSVRNNPSQFLNGLTSNTLDKPKNAFLDVHGKIIAAFDQLQMNDGEFFVLIERPFVEAVLKHLERFAKLSKAVIQEKDFKVYFDLEGNYSLSFGGDSNEFAIPQKRGQLIVSRKDLENTVSDQEFTLFRLRNNIPTHGIDYQNEMLLNVDEEEYVSFTKGCFLGQELVAKVHNRSKPTWKLVVKYEDGHSQEQRQEMTSRMIDPETNRIFGFAFVKNL